MNKSEKREVIKLTQIMRMAPDARPVGIDYLARAFSALIRSARTTKSRNEIICEASGVPAVIQHSEFKI
mgnify:CR=1 FL=1